MWTRLHLSITLNRTTTHRLAADWINLGFLVGTTVALVGFLSAVAALAGIVSLYVGYFSWALSRADAANDCLVMTWDGVHVRGVQWTGVMHFGWTRPI